VRGPAPNVALRRPLATRIRFEGFGEGNFQALYDSIELDQKKRGVL
jgi:4-hydroxyphenylpyruvate dioxygenase-like putative hemolysin